MKLQPSLLKALLTLILLAALLENVTSKKEKSGECKKYKGTSDCPNNFTEIYKEQKGNDDDDFDEKKKATRMCCTTDSDKEKMKQIEAIGCQSTSCMDPNQSGADDQNMCATLPNRWVDGKKMDYVEAVRDSCPMEYSNDIGLQALCCPKNSEEGMLTLLLGAEKHQFPHYAMIVVAHAEGNSRSFCGGTVYNERYIITASHCMLTEGVMKPTEGSKVLLDVRIANSKNPNSYEVEEFIVHPNSTRWDKPSKGSIYNDVALIKLKRDVQFGPHIKALPIAETGFDPFKYSNETVIIGIGTTDTTLTANMLQRARTYLRDDKKNIGNKHLWGKSFKMDQADGLLFLGGFQDGKISPRTGPGDSGGPAICKDKDGYALMCGLDSSGPTLERCEAKLNKQACKPGVFMEAQHYYDWFVSKAGNQDKAQVLKQPLFGAQVPKGKYEHQVHITTSNHDPCGGTLIAKDIVITAAHCVADDKGKRKRGIKVITGVRNLTSDTGKEFEVQGIKILDGYQRVEEGGRAKRIARLNVMPTPKYPYYKNDIALLKLKSNTDISSKKLPKIGPAPTSGGDEDDVVWTTEVSYPTDTSKSGVIQQRDFHILDHTTCQKRLDRVSYAGYDIQVDENILCGEEMYNGGAQCDRELGGGLICKGKDGKDVLCGVQVFRFCQLALPSAFLDINQYTDWVQQTKSKM